jgi:hypothetical protein
MDTGLFLQMTRRLQLLIQIVNLNIGNIRPGETVTVYIEILAGVETRDKGFRFRFPFTLAPAYHRQAQAVVNEWGQLDQELPEIVEAESRYSAHANGSSRGAGKRMRNRVIRELVQLSQIYGLANREMALVAVIKRSGDASGGPPITRVIPLGFEPETVEADACLAMTYPPNSIDASFDTEVSDAATVTGFEVHERQYDSGEDRYTVFIGVKTG